MTIQLPNLPFALNALEPLISAETLDYHYNKHHATYVNKLNNLIKGTVFEEQSLEGIMWSAEGAIFNNAAQVWNHSFFWNCLSPYGGGEVEGTLRNALSEQFAGIEGFKQAFTEAAISNFGSGWTWLIINQSGELEIINTSNADTPAAKARQQPILTIDVWEHAYYIDYRNARPKYLEAFWKLVNWRFVEQNYEDIMDVIND
tara:strand:+ start:225 stop:830 length:606 start_codon:yes stop_codon:yes gene_type:complete